VVRRGSAVHTVEVDGEAVVLNDGRLHLLNATGALVWACFDGDGTIAEIATDISEGLGVP
jgi:Coenzyme PQQ synthesis protein D (PqqD)